MKKLTTILFVTLIAIPLYAQEVKEQTTNTSPLEQRERNAIKINALSLLIGTGSIFYERQITDLFSAQMGAAYLSYTFGDTKFSGIIFTPEVKLYVRRDAINGFYLAPYLRYQRYDLTIERESDYNSEANYTNYGCGLAFGHQWIFKSGFLVDLFIGGHYGTGQISGQHSDGEQYETGKFEGIRPRVGVTIGAAF